MTDTPNKPTLKAERLASGGSVVSMPDFNYCDHFDVEADKAAFNAKWKNSSTPEEIKREKDLRDERLEKQRVKRAGPVTTKYRAQALRPELEALIDEYAPLRKKRNGFALAPGTHEAVHELAAIKNDDGFQKWSWRAIGEILGISDVTAKEIGLPGYGRKRSAYKAAA